MARDGLPSPDMLEREEEEGRREEGRPSVGGRLSVASHTDRRTEEQTDRRGLAGAEGSLVHFEVRSKSEVVSTAAYRQRCELSGSGWMNEWMDHRSMYEMRRAVSEVVVTFRVLERNNKMRQR